MYESGGHNHQREWFFICTNFDGRKMLVQIPYRSREDADQAAMRLPNAGEYEILSYPTRDKAEVYRRWKLENAGVY